MAVSDRQAPEAVAGTARPVALVVAAIASLQFGAALGVTLFDETGAAGAALVRMALAALVLLVLVRPRLRGRSRADWRAVLLFGLSLGLMNLAIYLSFDRIPLGIAVTIEFIGPLGLAAALSRRALDLVWVALAAAGVLLLADPVGEPLDPAGIALALTAAAGWAAYILLAQRAGASWPGIEGLAVAMAIGVLVPLVPGLLVGGSDLLAGEVLLVGLGVALLSSVLPYSLELVALRRLSARVFGVLMSIEPAVAAFAGLLVLSQALALRDWLAIALVCVASVGAARAPVPSAPAG